MVKTEAQIKKILKKAMKDVALVNKVSDISAYLHPTTLKELQDNIHRIQNILIAEYARFTIIKQELDLL